MGRAPGGTATLERRRWRFAATVGSLLLVGTGIAAVVASGPDRAAVDRQTTAETSRTGVDAARPDEVTIPEDGGPGAGDPDDGPHRDLDDADLAGTGLVDDGDGPAFACMVGSGCGWRADVSDLGDTLTVDPAGRDTLLVTGTEGVAALDRHGRRRWSQPWGPAAGGLPDARHPAAVAQVGGAVAAGPIVLTATRERLVGYAASSGKRRWSASGPNDARLHVDSRATADGSTVLAAYVGPGSGNEQGLPSLVRAHSAHHGGPRWEAQADAVVVGEEVVVLIDEMLTGLDARTGEQLWHTTFDGLASRPDGAAPPTVTFTGGDRLLLLPASFEEGGTELLDAATGEVTYTTDRDELVWARAADDDAEGTRIIVQRPDAVSEFLGIDAGGDPTWHRSGGLGDRCCQLLPSAEVLALAGPGDDGAVLLDPADGRALFGGAHPQGSVRFALGRDIVVVAHDASDSDVAVDLRDGGVRWRTRDAFPQTDVPGYWIYRLDGEVVGIPTDPRPDPGGGP